MRKRYRHKDIHEALGLLFQPFFYVGLFQDWLSNVSWFPAAASQCRLVPSQRDLAEQQALRQNRVEQTKMKSGGQVTKLVCQDFYRTYKKYHRKWTKKPSVKFWYDKLIFKGQK